MSIRTPRHAMGGTPKSIGTANTIGELQLRTGVPTSGGQASRRAKQSPRRVCGGRVLPLRSLFDHKLWRDHKGAVALSSLRLAVPVVIEYSVRHWFSRWRLNLRRLFFAFVLFAILFTIAGFVPAVRFQSVAAYEFARYDIRVNGPLTDEYVSSIREITRQQIVVPLTQVSTTMRANGLGTQADLYLLENAAHQSQTWFARELLVKGRSLSGDATNQTVVDVLLARRLHVGPGDNIVMESPFGDNQRFTVQVSGVYAPSGPMKNAALVSPGRFTAFVKDGLPSSGDEDTPVVYSDLLVGDGRGASGAIIGRLEDRLAGDSNLALEQRSDKLREARRSATEVLGAGATRTLPALVALVALVLLLREQHGRLLRRRRELGLLVSLGVSDPRARRLLLWETLVEATIAGLLALPTALWLLSERLYLFLPESGWRAMLWGFAAVLAAVAVAGYLQMAILFWRIPLARLITEEV